ncbi:hypothetical protein SAMN04488123_12245 [Natribacillus halophilus]|uniref:Transposase n=1 Tax=Natribacillus halophilus TaxID=549003 RepID=A0A1G8S5K6_9BACI|nr:hypothetical protein [Natribacillus halophilus]SDJ23940.1 hypothetical protein SAMN04488123_12245 [Natribacillus halophilus]
MSKRKRTSEVDKWIKEGRGTGSGAEYRPWLKVQDVSSLGRSTRLKGIKTGRQHEFLSDLELLDTVDIVHMEIGGQLRRLFPDNQEPQLDRILGLLGMDRSVYTTPISSKVVEINSQ